MSNLEDVFLKINQEFAPELFADLKGFGDRRMKGLDKRSPELLASGAGGIAGSTLTHSATDFSASGRNSAMRGVDSGSGSDNEQGSFDSANEEYDKQDGAQNLIRGSSCVRSCTAISGKRFIIYKRDWCGLLCQVVIPLVLVFFGLWL